MDYKIEPHEGGKYAKFVCGKCGKQCTLVGLPRKSFGAVSTHDVIYRVTCDQCGTLEPLISA